MKKIFLNKLLMILPFVFFSALTELSAQEEIVMSYSGTGGYTLVERTNLRRYVNGRYVGLTSREIRSFISPSLPPSKKYMAKGSVYSNDQWYDGSFYVMEETLRNNQAASAGIHDSIQSMFHISPTGKLTMYKDNGYPSFRSFPAYSIEKVKPGDEWKADAERSVDPLNKGVFTKMPMHVLYTFDGSEVYKGRKVYRIKAIWQTYYGNSNRDPAGDSTLEKAGGGHKADIIVLQSTGEPVLIVDQVDETFMWKDGTTVNFKGTITLFTEFPPAIDTDRIMLALNRVATVKGEQKSGNQKVSVSEAEKNNSLQNAGTVKSEKVNEELYGNDRNSNTLIAKADNGFGKGDAGSKVSSEILNDRNSKRVTDLNNRYANSQEKDPGQKFIPDDKFEDAYYDKKYDAPDKQVISGKNDLKKTVTAEKVSDEVLNPKNNIVAEETPAGIRLSVRDIKFAPDSAEVLPGEKDRLDQIAEVLKLAPQSQFLVEGHTASVGRPAGEQTLSEQRAHKIAEELAKRGVNGAAFICRGWGGNKPVASNDTDSGRAQNRRVEITILNR